MAENQVQKAKSPSRKLAFTLLGFALSAIALYVVFQKGDIDLNKLVTYVERIQIWPLFISVALYWAGVAIIRAYLIQVLLRSVGKVKMGTSYRYICIGFLANNILPLRMGEVVRFVGVAKKSKISVASTAGSLVVERLLDLSIAAVIGVLAILMAPLPFELRVAILVMGGVFVTILIILGLVARRGLKETDSSRYGRFIRFVWNALARFSRGFNALGNTKSVIWVLVLSVFIWILATLSVVFRLEAFDIEPTFALSVVLMASISLGVSIPSAPSGIGVIHGLAAGALVLMGIEKDLAFGFAFFLHLVDFVSSSALGAVCMVLEGMGLADLSRASSSASDES